MSAEIEPGQKLYFACVAGPDQGKRILLSDQPVVIGRSVDSNVLSDDRDVADRHAILNLKGGRPSLQAVAGATVFVDGHRREEGWLEPRQQVRLGRSLWQIVEDQTDEGIVGWIEGLGGHISTAAGVERIRGFSPRSMFSEVLRKRKDEEIEEYFSVGTASRTPPLQEIDTSWPKPWVFFRMFTLSVMVYLGFVFALREFNNQILIPGLITVGSFLIPFSILIFFFEVNVVRNVSLYQVMRLLLLGGILSLILSMFLFRWVHLDNWLGAASAGILEEVGKAAALLLVIHKLRYRWTLNGLLFGAAIGTGFSSFESAGYSFIYGMKFGQQTMLDLIVRRGVEDILGGHGLWTGLVGAALWRVRGDRPFSVEMLWDVRFLRVLAFAMSLHMIWNSPLRLPFYGKYIVLGFVAWVAILSFVQDGLKQIRQEQEKLRSPGG